MFSKGIKLPVSFFGIPVYLDVSFLIVLPLIAFLIGSSVPAYADMFGIVGGEALSAGILPYVFGLIAAIGLFVSVVLHELGHSLVARVYGVDVSRITLWFLGGMAHITEMPKRKGGEAVVGIAGPIVSYLLAGLFFVLIFAIPTPEIPGDGSKAAGSTEVLLAGAKFVTIYLALVNFILATFNMLPALPLDGGRIMRSLLAIRMSHVKATQVSVAVSRIIAVGLALLGLLGGGIFMVLIAAFIFFAGGAEARQTIIADLLAGLRARDLMSQDIDTVPSDARAEDLAEWMIERHHAAFPVENERGELIGLVTLETLNQAGPDQTVATLAEPLTSMPQTTAASEALRRLAGVRAGRAIVLDDEGRPVGLLSQTDLQRAAQVRSVERGWEGGRRL